MQLQQKREKGDCKSICCNCQFSKISDPCLCVCGNINICLDVHVSWYIWSVHFVRLPEQLSCRVRSDTEWPCCYLAAAGRRAINMTVKFWFRIIYFEKRKQKNAERRRKKLEEAGRAEKTNLPEKVVIETEELQMGDLAADVKCKGMGSSAVLCSSHEVR